MRKILLTVILTLTVLSAAAQLRITSISCNHQSTLALVNSDKRIILGWQLTSDRNGARQQAYEIEIIDNINGKLIWNSGKTTSSESQMITIQPLMFTQNGYRWRVRVWDDNDAVSEWSAYQQIRTVPQSFGAKWIGAITRKDAKLPDERFSNAEFKKPAFKAAWKDVDTLSARSIIVRKDFDARRKATNAIAYICGLGHYELSINGKKVGDSEFAPLWSEYDKTVYYNAYDVTSYIQKGDNAIGVLLGNGFFNVQRLGRYSKLAIGFGAPSLMMRLEITYDDGTCSTVVTDGTWHYSFSPITYNCIYGGESYDARLEQKGWDKPHFKENGWKRVVAVEGPKGRLTPQTAPPVKIMERYDVATYTKLGNEQIASASKSTKRNVDASAFVVDMGQNLAGFPEITVSGKRGQKITLFVSEKLNDDGSCDQSQSGRPYFFEYTLCGDGKETWHPRFSYYGFRYIQVEGAAMQGKENPSKLPVINKIQSCFVYNSAPEVSSFECSNDIFNKTHRIIERAERSNMQAVFTDCPHREKLGWLEQDQLCGPSLLYNYDISTFVPKIIQDIADAQKPDGMVPTTAPQYVSFGNLFDNSPEWGSTLIILPFLYYDMYGDSTMISDYYPNMRRYVDYLSSRAEDGIIDFGLGDWYDYGPWVSGFSRNTPIALVATAHYLFDLKFITRAARMVGNSYDQTHYSDLLSNVTDAFNRHFYHADSCYYGTNSQTSNALPLFLGITGVNKDAVMQNLINDIHAHGDRLTTGEVGNRYLFQALARNGHNDLMYKMMNHYDAPGYGYQLKTGATTLSEQWDPKKGSSLNHFMLGQIDEWFFRNLGGIQNQPGTFGMRHLLIAPSLPGDMTSISTSTKNLYGTIKIKTSKTSVEADVPVGCDAIVVTPDGSRHPIGSGHYTFHY